MGQVSLQDWMACGCCAPEGELAYEVEVKSGVAKGAGYSFNTLTSHRLQYPFFDRYQLWQRRDAYSRTDALTVDSTGSYSYFRQTDVVREYDAKAYLTGVDPVPSSSIISDVTNSSGTLPSLAYDTTTTTETHASPVHEHTTHQTVDSGEFDGSTRDDVDRDTMSNAVSWADIAAALDYDKLSWSAGGSLELYTYQEGLYDGSEAEWVGVPWEMAGRVARLRVTFESESVEVWREIKYKTITSYYVPYSDGQIDSETDPVESGELTREFDRIEGEDYSDWWELPEAAEGEKVEYVILAYRTYHSSQWILV